MAFNFQLSFILKSDESPQDMMNHLQISSHFFGIKINKVEMTSLLPALITFGEQIESVLRPALSYCHRTLRSLQDYHLSASTRRLNNQHRISTLTHKR